MTQLSGKTAPFDKSFKRASVAENHCQLLFKKTKTAGVFKMKLLFAILSLGILSSMAMAEELPVVSVSTSMKEEWGSGALQHGQNSHSGTIGEAKYPNLWSYWVVASGDTPQTFVLEPLKANRKSPSAKKTNILTPYENVSFPGLHDNYFAANTKSQTAGAGYAFTNPFNHKIKVIIEGCINYKDAANKVYVYTKSPDGAVNILTSTDNPGGLVDVPESNREGARMRKYLKLQCETELEAGGQIYIIGYNANTATVTTNAGGVFLLFYFNDNWGPLYQPVFIVEKNTK